MKIEQKLILSNVMYGVVIVLIGLFAFDNMNLVMTKLRFVEIADDLNASFLVMRLSEKNYFLHHDRAELNDILQKIEQTKQSIQDVREDIVKAIGSDELARLEAYLTAYGAAIERAASHGDGGPDEEALIRIEGKRLKEFSKSITQMERGRMNDIILGSKRILVISFSAILFVALLLGHFISQKILRSLREIEKLAHSISEGNFNRIEGFKTKDELGSVITAINSMSEELAHREEQILQSKKLASLGILTAGVAHEITNPLNNISMIAQTSQEISASLSESDHLDLMRKIDAETERIRKIVKNLLDFSKPKEAHPKESNINDVIRKTLTLVQNMIDIQNIETVINLEKDLPRLFIDGHQIQQVFVNLVTNAVQAMQPGGRLYIASRHGKGRESVEVTVMDTGKGIPPEYLPHIFDPFFSTKGEGGTGLGLSVSYGIIRNHKGEIRVESKVGVGTTFTVELPVQVRGLRTDEVIAPEESETVGKA
ncbi:MAG TPA: ATP-binding protein [Nitrospirota bacterium]|nr:ATP-binding protein [Nitrospirota bacterium]